MSSKTSSKKKEEPNKLALKGSAKLVTEFFHYSIHNILYQREVYPAEDFTHIKKYGIPMLVSTDDEVKAYVKKIMSQLDRWMKRGKISKLVLVITNKTSGEHVERWQFDVQIMAPQKVSKDGAGDENTGTAKSDPATSPDPTKTDAEIESEIQALFRQITASATFLPSSACRDCTFNVLVYADADSEVPVEWGDSDAKEIANGEKVQLRAFSTTNHRVDTVVSYRMDD